MIYLLQILQENISLSSSRTYQSIVEQFKELEITIANEIKFSTIDELCQFIKVKFLDDVVRQV